MSYATNVSAINADPNACTVWRRFAKYAITSFIEYLLFKKYKTKKNLFNVVKCLFETASRLLVHKLYIYKKMIKFVSN